MAQKRQSTLWSELVGGHGKTDCKKKNSNKSCHSGTDRLRAEASPTAPAPQRFVGVLVREEERETRGLDGAEACRGDGAATVVEPAAEPPRPRPLPLIRRRLLGEEVEASGERVESGRPRPSVTVSTAWPAPRALSGLEAWEALLDRRRRIGERGSGHRVGIFLSSAWRKYSRQAVVKRIWRSVLNSSRSVLRKLSAEGERGGIFKYCHSESK